MGCLFCFYYKMILFPEILKYIFIKLFIVFVSGDQIPLKRCLIVHFTIPCHSLVRRVCIVGRRTDKGLLVKVSSNVVKPHVGICCGLLAWC